jgi:hypothetical protein
MKTITNKLLRGASVALIAFSSLGFAQDQPPEQRATNPGGWRKFGDATGDQQRNTEQRNDVPDAASQGAPAAEPRGDYQRNEVVPPQLTLRQGTFITVRINEMLSSDRNQPGDAFTATLDRPLVVDGITVAHRGQTIAGRVAEAQKAGRVEGVSKLGVELTELTLVDGQQATLRSQMLGRTGNNSVARDAGAVAATTATGAMIGAAADWGRGAAIGAGAGAAAGVIGVLLTRGHATVIYPESVLTFRVEAPVTISTERAPQAFRYASPDDYNQTQGSRPPPRLSQRTDNGCGPYGCQPAAPAPYYYGPAYDPYYFYGPSIGFYVGPRFGYYGRGYSRGGFRR